MDKTTPFIRMDFGLRPVSQLKLAMYEHISARVVRKLAERWDVRNRILDNFLPKQLKGKLTDSEILREVARLGRFEEERFKTALPRISRDEVLGRVDTRAKALVLGVNQEATGSRVLADSAKEGLEPVFVDISRENCEKARQSLESQQEELRDRRVTHAHFQVLNAEIHNFLLGPKKFDIDLDDVKFWFFPLILGYLLPATAALSLEKAGQSLSESKNPNKSNRILLIGLWRDYNPFRQGQGREDMRYDRLRDVMARIRDGAGGPKLEMKEEKKFIYFEEVVSAITIGAK